MMVVGRRDGLPVVRLPAYGRATVSRVADRDATMYEIVTLRAGDRRVQVRGRTPIHPDLWDAEFYSGVARSFGVTEDELRRAVMEFRARETE